MSTLFFRAIAAITASVVVVSGAVVFGAAPAEAAAAPSDFDGSLLISDAVMYDPGTMSVAGIQDFLNKKEPVCSTGYICLKNYSATTTNYRVPANGSYIQNLCATYPGAANESAATIIYKIAHACGVNPQALLVTLEKEQRLVSRTDPGSLTYRKAMGYGCPDTAQCDADFYGFFKQLYWGARAFVRPVSTSNRYAPGRRTTVQYSPNSACGAKTMTIQNKATANLYIYTPYTPNSAAVQNLYGRGDGCSAYGNRNFWRLFTDWFGSPVLADKYVRYVQAVYRDVMARGASIREYPGWVKAIQKGMPRQQVASGFVTSTEYRLLRIVAAYKDVLNRAPEPGGKESWLAGIQKGILTPDDVYQTFLGSQEFYLHNGNTNPLFVDALYRKVIGRPASANEQAYWSGLVVKNGRKFVVAPIYNAPETAKARVDLAFQLYLGRHASDAEKVMWGSYIRNSGQLAFRAKILGSDEYWRRAQLTPATA